MPQLHCNCAQLPQLPQAFAGKRIAHISDIHLGFHRRLAELQAIVGLML